MKNHLRGHRLVSHMYCSHEHILPPPGWRGRTPLPSCTCGLRSPLPLSLEDFFFFSFRDSSSVHCTYICLNINNGWGGQGGRDSSVGPRLHSFAARLHHLVFWACCTPCLVGSGEEAGLLDQPSLTSQALGRWPQEADFVSLHCGRATTLIMIPGMHRGWPLWLMI